MHNREAPETIGSSGGRCTCIPQEREGQVAAPDRPLIWKAIAEVLYGMSSGLKTGQHFGIFWRRQAWQTGWSVIEPRLWVSSAACSSITGDAVESCPACTPRRSCSMRSARVMSLVEVIVLRTRAHFHGGRSYAGDRTYPVLARGRASRTRSNSLAWRSSGEEPVAVGWLLEQRRAPVPSAMRR